MKRCLFTIYMLDEDSVKKSQFNKFINLIVNDFNDNQEEEDKKFLPTLDKKYKFNYISTYQLYYREATSRPDWMDALENITDDFYNYKNNNHSFVLFMLVENKVFVATAGNGHILINEDKKSNFGLEVINRLIKPNDNYVKKINDKHITGNKVSGASQFNNNVNIYSEQDTNNMFKELELILPIETINEKLGLKIKTNKESYRFFAKDSIKLSKSMDLKELDVFIYSLTKLLQIKPSYKLLLADEINSNDPIINLLNERLANKFIQFLYNRNSVNELKLYPIQIPCDEQLIKYSKSKNATQSFTNEAELLEFIQMQFSNKMTIANILNKLNDIQLIAMTENKMIDKYSLFKQLDTIITYKNQNYWFTEGKWLLITNEYNERVNETFLKRIGQYYNPSFSLNSMKPWLQGTEGEYNFSHNKLNNVYVMDKILIHNIELCDLLIEENNELYFIHVKDGFDGNMRVLYNQIDYAMKILSNALDYGGNELTLFYQSIKSKIKGSDNKSDIELAAEKFINKFKHEKDFIRLVNKYKHNICFVFAFRPKASNNILNPETIKSTNAKLSMIDMTKAIGAYNFKLRFLEINKFQMVANNDNKTVKQLSLW